MAVYIIRPNTTFSIVKNNVIYVGGDSVDLTLQEVELHKHKLEGVENTVPPLNLTTSNSCFPKPVISKVEPNKILVNQDLPTQTQKITIFGSYLTPTSTVETTAGGVDDVEFVSSTQLEITLSISSDLKIHSLTVDNGSKTVANEAISFIFFSGALVDLRVNGTDLSNIAIERKSNMIFDRNLEGMVFSGQSPWGSFARFPGGDRKFVWNKTDQKKLTWICTNSEPMMLGIARPDTDPNAVHQHNQAEVVAYLLGNSLYGFRGNNGNINQTTSVNLDTVAKSSSDIIKLVFIPKIGQDWLFELYKIPSANIDDWFNTDNLLARIELTGFGASDRDNLPFCVPPDGDGGKFIGFFLEDL